MNLKDKQYIVQLIYTETTKYAGGVVEFNEHSGIHTLQSKDKEKMKKIWTELSYLLTEKANVLAE